MWAAWPVVVVQASALCLLSPGVTGRQGCLPPSELLPRLVPGDTK